MQIEVTDDVDNGAVAWDPDGSGGFTYTPNADFNGVDSFTYRAVDGDDAASDEVMVVITVEARNDAPVAHNGVLVTDEDTSRDGNLAGNDTDDQVTGYQITQAPANGGLVLNDPATGAYTYHPNGDFHGADSFQFVAVDSHRVRSAPATIGIIVNPINDAPVFVAPTPDARIVVDRQAGDLGFTVRATDVDNDPVTYGINGLPAGSAFDAATGAFNWPAAAQNAGEYVLTLQATDGTLTTERALTIEVVWVLIDSDGDGLDDRIDDDDA